MTTQIDVSFPLPDGYITDDMLSSAFRCPVNRQESVTSAVHNITYAEMRKPADMTAVLPSSNVTGDAFLKLTSGTHGTASPVIQTPNFAGASGTQGLRYTFALPPNYESAKGIVVRVRAKWSSDVADGTNNLDVRAYLSDDMAGIGSDLVTTAVQTPTASAVDYSYVVSPTGLSAGDILDVVVDWDISDTAGTTVVGNIGRVDMLVQTQG